MHLAMQCLITPVVQQWLANVHVHPVFLRPTGARALMCDGRLTVPLGFNRDLCSLAVQRPGLIRAHGVAGC
jgi:hypothetical protein